MDSPTEHVGPAGTGGTGRLGALTPHTCAPGLGWALGDKDCAGTLKERTCEMYAGGNLEGGESPVPRRKLSQGEDKPSSYGADAELAACTAHRCVQLAHVVF